MSLDEKLERILGNKDHPYFTFNKVEQIKQAFIDEGYRHNLAAGYWKREAEREGLMTGQEWLSKFTQEFESLLETSNKPLVKDIAMDAARRASQVEEKS